jgi:hypothetical protein
MLTLAAVVVIVLAGCGSSSKTTSSSASTGAASATQNAQRANRFAALRACLQKAGIKLPSASSGGRPQSGRTPGAGRGFKLPSGVSGAKFREALSKCGGGFPRGARGSLTSPTARAALVKYATCMREHGVNLPAPNTSGNGPIFSTKGINALGAAFKAAQRKCASDVKGILGAGRPPGAGGGAPAAGGEGRPPGGPPASEGSAGA